MIFNEHKYKKLAENIEQEYITLCGKQPCGECRYAFMPYYKTLFILDYLDKKKAKNLHTIKNPYVEAISQIKKDIKQHNKYKKYLQNISKEELIRIEKSLGDDE